MLLPGSITNRKALYKSLMALASEVPPCLAAVKNAPARVLLFKVLVLFRITLRAFSTGNEK